MGFWKGVLRSLGRPPLREHVVVSEAADRATRRRARTAVDEGRAAPDPAAARVAVALARNRQQVRAPGATASWLVVVLVAAGVVFVVLAGFDGPRVLRVAVGLLYLGLAAWLVRRRTREGRATEAERRNRDLLLAAGTPYADDSWGLVVPTWGQRLVGVVLAGLVLWALATGLSRVAVDSTGWGDTLPVVLGMSLANLVDVSRAARAPVRVSVGAGR